MDIEQEKRKMEDLMVSVLECGYNDLPLLLIALRNTEWLTGKNAGQILSSLNKDFETNHGFSQVMFEILAEAVEYYKDKIVQYIAEETGKDLEEIKSWLMKQNEFAIWINGVDTNISEDILNYIVFSAENIQEIMDMLEKAKRQYLEEFRK